MNTLQVKKNGQCYEYRTDFMPWQYGGASFDAAVKSASARVSFDKVIDLTEVTVEIFATGRRVSMSRDCYDRSGPIGRVVAVDGQKILNDAPF